MLNKYFNWKTAKINVAIFSKRNTKLDKKQKEKNKKRMTFLNK